MEEGKAEMLARQEKVATRPASGRPRPREADRHVGARVRERRIVLGLTQQRVGEAIGVTPQQAHKYEQGVNRITAGHLYLLARALGVGVGGAAPLRDVREAVLRLRRRKGMVVDPDDPDSVSAGSFFTNPILDAGEFERLERRVRERLGDDAAPPRFPEPDGRVKTSAAWLVERAGFARGYGSPGPVALSGKHTLALTNRGGATAVQLLALAREIADGVKREFGVDLVPEPVLVGQAWVEVASPS